jgi:hypothetical protein
MSGPYFKGQQPADCGHFFPDVLRLRDERSADGKFVRVVDLPIAAGMRSS